MTDIPDRDEDPRGFALYAASVMDAFARGCAIEYRSHFADAAWRPLADQCWEWNCADYRIAKPKTKSRRWYTDEELMHLVHDWPARFLVKYNGDNRLAIVSVIGLGLKAHIKPDYAGVIDGGNFLEYSVSLDGGRTWQPLGVEE